MELRTDDNSLPLQTPTGASVILGCSVQTVINLANSGRLPHFLDSSQRRLFRPNDLVALKRARTRKPLLT